MTGSAAVRVVCVTVGPMLAPAVVMARSLREHHPDWGLDLVLVGRRPADVPTDDVSVVPAEELLDIDPEDVLLRTGYEELITMMALGLLQTKAPDAGSPILHLPPTAWVCSDLSPLASRLRDRKILLAPRVAEALPLDGLSPTPDQLARHGRIATDVIGVTPSPVADRFLRWWGKRASAVLDDPDVSRRDRTWTAQRWLELAPALFAPALLNGPGDHLSAWNLHEHTLSLHGDAIRVDGQAPLRLMDWAGFDPRRPFALRPDASRIRISRSPVLRALSIRYAHALESAGWSDVTRRDQVGSRLHNDMAFDRKLQDLYAIAETLGAELGDPCSAAGTDALMAWLNGPAPRGGALGVTRYLYSRVMRERPDVVAAFPDLNGDGGRGLVAWCSSSGREELGIPQPLMPHARAEEVNGAPESPAAVAAGEGAAPLGVRVSGYLGHILGLGAAARGYAQALAAAEVPISTVTVSLDHVRPAAILAPEYGLHAHADLAPSGEHAFELLCVNPDELPDFVERVGNDYFSGTRIGVWGWETNSIPSRWTAAFALVDEIWVYSTFVARNLAAATDVPVLALPPPVLAPQPPARRNRLGLDERFLFLFVFDYSSTIQRKNPVGLIDAFRRAFDPGEGPQLLIKTINAPLLPLAEEEVLWAAEGHPDIHLIDRSLTSEERDGLMAGCDCYVSLHRSEGFGLTMAEAMAIGKPVIASGYSGNVDFMNDENSFLVPCGLTRVGADVQIYPADGEWGEPDLDEAARLMRHVHAHPEQAARVGARARQDVSQRLSPATTGAAMRRRLEQLAGRALPSDPPSGGRWG